MRCTQCALAIYLARMWRHESWQKKKGKKWHQKINYIQTLQNSQHFVFLRIQQQFCLICDLIGESVASLWDTSQRQMGGRRLSGAGGTTSPSCSRRALRGPASGGSSRTSSCASELKPASTKTDGWMQTLHVERIFYCFSFKLSSNSDERTSFSPKKPGWLQILSARMQIPAAPIGWDESPLRLWIL